MTDIIIWDWNGTLIDDLDAAIASVNAISKTRGVAPIGRTEYYDYMEMPIVRFYEHLFDMKKVSLDELVGEFNEHYHELIGTGILHEGARECLERFRRGGAAQMILTSSLQADVERVCEGLGIREYFQAIIGAEDRRAEGKVERAKQWFVREAVDPETALLIGDTVHDFEAASAIGCRCILFSGGHQSRTDLEACGVRVVDSLNEIVMDLKK